jgi:hypothetical protein
MQLVVAKRLARLTDTLADIRKQARFNLFPCALPGLV